MSNDLNLTREQRHECYKMALDYFINIKVANNDRYSLNKFGFICPELEKYAKELYNIIIPLEIEVALLFPELLRFKPEQERVDNIWWELHDVQSRIDTLEKCINLTKDENETQSR